MTKVDPSRIVVERLRVRSFRNLRSIELMPAARLNVIAGDNGQGKTSLIEALYVVATSRSFRTGRLAEVISQGQETSSVQLRVAHDGRTSEQSARITARGRSWLLDGKRPLRLVDYATRTPVVVFHPGDLALVSGAAQGRRTLLDRVALFTDPVSGDARLRYGRALRARQRVLEQRGVDAPDLDAIEAVAAAQGVRLSQARAEAATRLGVAMSSAFAKLTDPELELRTEYAPGGASDVVEFLRQLKTCRAKDKLRRSASCGPGRDDLRVYLSGRPAKSFASQGQQRLLALSIKMAELACVAETSSVEPLLLLDDVSSELDPTRTGAVYEFLRQTRSQVFVTTTRPELFVTPSLGHDERADFVLHEGQFV